jgi:hypothetical protein
MTRAATWAALSAAAPPLPRCAIILGRSEQYIWLAVHLARCVDLFQSPRSRGGLHAWIHAILSRTVHVRVRAYMR